MLVFDILLSAKNKQEASCLFDIYIKHLMENNIDLTKECIIERAKSNIGYFACYYGADEQDKIQNLYKCVHPIFGAVDDSKQIDQEEILATGIKIGENYKETGKIDIDFKQQPKSMP